MKEWCKKIVVAVLTLEARLLLRRKQPKIVAVTGSVGKTGAKDAIYEVLKTRVRVQKSEKSFNSELGVPLSVLGLQSAWGSAFGWLTTLLAGARTALFAKAYPEWLVLEVGVDRPGDMARITRWLRPDVVALTRLPDVPVHVEYFGAPEEVIREKMHLVAALKTDGAFIYNNDDEHVRAAAEGVRQKSFGFSRYSKSDFTAVGDKVTYERGIPTGMEFTLSHEGERATVRIEGSLGIQHAYNAACAAAVGSLVDIPLADAAAALSSYTPAPGRMRLIAGLKDSFIIDDTYNSSPTALLSALQTLKEVKTKGRRIAVIGDMLELGRYAMRAHEEAGAQVAECAEILITVGVRARGIAKAALAGGMSEERIFQHDDALAAGNELEAMISASDVALVKGSQGMRMERVVEEVMAHPEDAPTLLVRQDKEWRER